MKTFLQKNRIAVIAIAVVLCFGILSGLIVSGVIRLSMTERSITTVAEAKEEEQKKTAGENGDSALQMMPTPTPAVRGITLTPEDVSKIAREVDMRRRNIIPIRTSSWTAANRMLWNEEMPSQEQIDLARQAAAEYAQMLFGQSYADLTGYPAESAAVQFFSDKDGDRDQILQVTDPDKTLIVTVRASDSKLICADLLTYPETVTANKELDVLDLAKALGYHAQNYRKDANERGARESVYLLTTDTDECLSFSYCGDRLWQAAVYPNKAAMESCEYFLADIQFEFTDPAYPENFVMAEPPKSSETFRVLNEEKIYASLSRLYRNLSGEELDTSKLTATFYRDESGAREDCWKITGEGFETVIRDESGASENCRIITGEAFEIVISAYSCNVISFTGSIPCKDLLAIPYKQMGGEEYEAATRIIAENLILSLGGFAGRSNEKTAKEIEVNAVYDGNYCTMDIVTNDGAWYECYYEGGVLKEIWCFANEQLFMHGPWGWVADAVYIHPYTGKPFIPEYRDWDGDLHVKARPEN